MVVCTLRPYLEKPTLWEEGAKKAQSLTFYAFIHIRIYYYYCFHSYIGDLIYVYLCFYVSVGLNPARVFFCDDDRLYCVFYCGSHLDWRDHFSLMKIFLFLLGFCCVDVCF